MNRISLILALGLAAFSGSVVEAADWNNGAKGIKDHGGMAGVPVPAPVPVMESFSWYVRADLGVGVYGGGNFHERGLQFGLDNGDPATTPIGTQSSWYDSDFDYFVSGGVGVGRYFTPRIRGDITVDTRTDNEINGNGRYTFLQATGNPRVLTGNTVTGTLEERIRVRDNTAMANVYFDLRERGAFTPYIGLGFGLAARSVSRSAVWSEVVTNAAGTTVGTQSTNAKLTSHVAAPAASATVGTAIALSHGRVLDFNYRYTYIGDAEMSMNLGGMRTVGTIGDTHEHALRAGLRWNVW